MTNTLRALVEAFVLHRVRSMNLDMVSLSESRDVHPCGAPTVYEIQERAMAWVRELSMVEPAVIRFGVLCHVDHSGLQFSVIGIDVWRQLERQHG